MERLCNTNRLIYASLCVLYRNVNWKTTPHSRQVNGLVFPHIIHNITHRILKFMLEMTSVNFQTCLISKELKHRKPLLQISYDAFYMFISYMGFHNKNPRIKLHCTLTNKINVRYSTLHIWQQIKLDCVTYVMQCTVHTPIWLAVCVMQLPLNMQRRIANF
jgi:hypothetical protein